MKRLIPIFAMTLAIGGCATELTSGGSRIRVLTQAEAKICAPVQYVSVSLPLGSAQDAQRAALNQAAALGGDSIYIFFTWSDPLRGSQVQGNAMRCKFG
jgi:hypothetical protein